MKIEKLGVKELRVSREECDIYKIQNLKYKRQLSALFFDDADFLYLVVFFTHDNFFVYRNLITFVVETKRTH